MPIYLFTTEDCLTLNVSHRHQGHRRSPTGSTVFTRLASSTLYSLRHVLTKEVNLRNAVLLRSVFLLAEVGLIDKCHLSFKQKLLGTEEYDYETHDTRKIR